MAEAHSQRLFAYGTLQLERVQLATFGRRLSGSVDTLARFTLVPLKIDDDDVIAVSGKAEHSMATFTGNDSDRISGVVYDLSCDELAAADGYEVPAVERVAVVLESGTRAWAYVDSRITPSESRHD